MNVKELIEELETKPQDWEVKVDIDWTHMSINSVFLFEGNISTKEKYVLID